MSLRKSIFNALASDDQMQLPDQIEIGYSLTIHEKTERPQSFFDYFLNVKPTTEVSSDHGSTYICNSTSSNDDFEKIIATIKFALDSCNPNTITNFQITAKGRWKGEDINLEWKELEGFREFLQNKRLINHPGWQLQ